MNTYDGEVKEQSYEEMQAAQKPPMQVWKDILASALTDQQRRQLASTGRTHLSRNSACLCGSGKRFKNCCYTGPQNEETISVANHGDD